MACTNPPEAMETDLSVLPVPTADARFWIGVACRRHVRLGIAGGFCQLCHGKGQPLRKMKKGDWLIYYSPRETLDSPASCQQFTAIGELTGDTVYPFAMAPGFTPYRRDVRFLPAQDVQIRPLIDRLSFIPDKTHWGHVFRYGHLQIPRADFMQIAQAMLLEQQVLSC